MTELDFRLEEPGPGEERARYEDLFEFAPVSYLVTDSAGMILEANRAACALLKVGDHTRLVGKPIAIFVPSGNRKQFRQTLLGLVHTATEAEWELELESRDGNRFHAQINAARSHGRLRWTILDISERAQNEHRLRTLASALEERVLERTDELEHERARLMAIVEQMPGGLVVIEAPSGQVLTMNEEAQEILGAIHTLREASPLARALEGEYVVSERVELVKPNGAFCVLSVSAAPVLDRAGRVTAAVSIFEEITEQEARNRAEREFVTNAAHELQSPLAAIASAVDVLQAGAKDAPERDLFIDHIERESQRLVRLTRALLTLARAQTDVEEPRREVVDLCPLLEAVLERVEAPESVEVTLDCSPEIAVVANRELLEQLLVNIVRNAVKYTDAGSIRVEGDLRDGRAQVLVIDTGIGIAPDVLPRVAERFYRGEESREGFGLGLAIVQAALETMDGKLDIASEGPGQGTTVTISLPLGATRMVT